MNKKLDINIGDYKKDNQLINRLDYLNNKNQPATITLNEEKLLEYFFFSLQKRHIIKKEVKKEDFIWKNGNHLYFKKENGELINDVDFEIELYGLKNFIKVDKQNYIKYINDLLGKFASNRICYIRNIKNGVQKRTIMPIRDFFVEKINGEKKFTVSVTLNVEFLYLSLFRNGQYTPLNIDIVKNIHSKYSLRIYQEIEKALNLNYEKLPLRSLKSMNEFFGSNLSKQEVDRKFLQAKKELLLKKMYSFDYEIYKNDSKEWIFKIYNIKKLNENDIIFDYIKTYIDYRLLTQELKKEFQSSYENKFIEIVENITEQEKSTFDSRTLHLQSKEK